MKARGHNLRPGADELAFVHTQRAGLVRSVIGLGILAAFFLSNLAKLALATEPGLRLNQVQVIGTHNSYKIRPSAAIMRLINWYDRKLGAALDYAHPPLRDQLQYLGVRQLEFDVFYDPVGGHYASPRGPRLAGERPDHLTVAPPLAAPGLKVLHIQDIDYRSHCLTFASCLQELKAWSSDNPAHLPVMVLIEARDESLPDPFQLGFAVPFPINQDFVEKIDEEILAIFSREDLITPDSVRGQYASLEAAILEHGWPLLSEVRGKIMFTLDNSGKARDLYTAGHSALRGRVMFTNSARGTPEAAFIKLNSPLGANQNYIKSLVKAGYLVRTRADSATHQERHSDDNQKEAALSSGAHFISTDFPASAGALPLHDINFAAGHLVRCNPITAPIPCPL